MHSFECSGPPIPTPRRRNHGWTPTIVPFVTQGHASFCSSVVISLTCPYELVLFFRTIHHLNRSSNQDSEASSHVFSVAQCVLPPRAQHLVFSIVVAVCVCVVWVGVFSEMCTVVHLLISSSRWHQAHAANVQAAAGASPRHSAARS